MNNDEILAKVKRYITNIDAALEPAAVVGDRITEWLTEGQELKRQLRKFMRGHDRRMKELYEFVREHLADDADWWKR